MGLKVIKSSPGWAELDADGTTIALHAASEDGQSGSSPILSFHVDDVYGTIATLEKMGATLEGSVREPSFGKVAAMRTPDGSIISLLQPARVETPSHWYLIQAINRYRIYGVRLISSFNKLCYKYRVLASIPWTQV